MIKVNYIKSDQALLTGIAVNFKVKTDYCMCLLFFITGCCCFFLMILSRGMPLVLVLLITIVGLRRRVVVVQLTLFLPLHHLHFFFFGRLHYAQVMTCLVASFSNFKRLFSLRQSLCHSSLASGCSSTLPYSHL